MLTIKEWFSTIELEQLQLELNSLLILKSNINPEARYICTILFAKS